MSTVSTLFQLANHAKKGVGYQDKWLAFLVSGFGVIDRKRTNIRQYFLKQINCFSLTDFIQIKLFINHRSMYLSMRKKNEADYLIVG